MHLKIWARENDIRDKARKIDLQKKWTTFIKKKKKQNKTKQRGKQTRLSTRKGNLLGNLQAKQKGGRRKLNEVQVSLAKIRR